MRRLPEGQRYYVHMITERLRNMIHILKRMLNGIKKHPIFNRKGNNNPSYF